MFQDLLTPDTFEAFFARYLLAGYIVIIVRSRFIIGLRPKPAEVVIEALIFSLINQLVFLLIASFLPIDRLNELADNALFFFEVLFLPTLLGLALGWNLSRGWNHAILRRLSLPISRPTSRAYDFAFDRVRAPSLVIVTFQDGSAVYGLYGENSFASNDPGNSDLFLECLYDVDDTGEWRETSPTRSALVSLSGVRSIEFLDEVEDESG